MKAENRYTVLTGRDQFEQLYFTVYDRSLKISLAFKGTKQECWAEAQRLENQVPSL